MEIDFYQQYKEYSNVDLLKIVRRPADYQLQAVDVATQILSQRQVTAEEIQFVDQYLQDIESSAKVKKEKVDALKYKITDFFEPISHPSENVSPSKWVNILLFVIAIQYVWSLFNTAKRLIRFLRCDYCRLDVLFFAELLTLLYVPVIFFLLLQNFQCLGGIGLQTEFLQL